MLEFLSAYWHFVLLGLLLLLVILVRIDWQYPFINRAWDATTHKFRDASRAWPLLLLFTLTFAVVMWLNPIKGELIIYGASKIAFFAWLGYWADRLAFRPEDRPHLLEGISRGTAWKRRSLIVAAAILAGGMTP